MRNPIQTEPQNAADTGMTSYEMHGDALSELGRATTLYHEAPPEQLENAREEYEQALRRFKAVGFYSTASE